MNIALQSLSNTRIALTLTRVLFFKIDQYYLEGLVSLIFC